MALYDPLGKLPPPDYEGGPAPEITLPKRGRDLTPWGYRTIPLYPVPSPKVQEKIAPRELGITFAQAGDPVPYVFGHTLVRPKIVAVTSSADKLYVDYLIAQGPCEEIVKIYQAGQDVSLPTDFEYYTGSASPVVASPLMVAALGSYDTLENMCHFVAVLDPGESIDMMVEVKGIHLIDPRTSPHTTAYSNNPALALARIYSDCGYTINWASVATCADFCDENPGAASPVQKRWTIDMYCDGRNKLSTWAQGIAAYANVLVDIQGGTVYMYPNAAATSSPQHVRSVTASDILAGSARTEKVGARDRPEQVTVHYRQLDGTQLTATAGTGSTGQVARIQMPGFQSYTMAKRYATQTLNLAQADLRHSHTAFAVGLSDAIGDIHSITYAPHGLSNKLMRLVGYREVQRGLWEREYVEHDNALYDDSTYAAPSLGDTSLPDPNTPPTPSGLTVTEELYQDETATTYSRLKILWTGTNWPYARGYQVIATGEATVLNLLVPHEGTGSHVVHTPAIKQGVTYSVTVKVQSSSGALSATAASTTKVGQGKLLAPNPPTSLTGFEAGNLVSLSWTASVEIEGDLRGYTIKRIPEADWTGAESDWTNANAVKMVERLDSTTYLTNAQPAGTFYYGVRAYDNSGLASTTAWVQVVVTNSGGTNAVNLLGTGSVTNMHTYRVDGDANYAITADTTQTWASRFGNTSPLATWSDAVTSSPAERWFGDLATDSSFTTEVWDAGALRQGSWYFTTSNVTTLGGTRSTVISLGDESSPISYSNHSGTSVAAPGRYFKGTVSTTDSPASAGDGLFIRLPLQVTFTGASVTQTGTSTISATSPLDNPKTVTFTQSYSQAPSVQVVLKGSAAKIVAVDNITTTAFDWYCWTTAGALTDGEIDWTATGT